jgi:hypothetical protein
MTTTMTATTTATDTTTTDAASGDGDGFAVAQQAACDQLADVCDAGCPIRRLDVLSRIRKPDGALDAWPAPRRPG